MLIYSVYKVRSQLNKPVPSLQPTEKHMTFKSPVRILIEIMSNFKLQIHTTTWNTMCVKFIISPLMLCRIYQIIIDTITFCMLCNFGLIPHNYLLCARHRHPHTNINTQLFIYSYPGLALLLNSITWHSIYSDVAICDTSSTCEHGEMFVTETERKVLLVMDPEGEVIPSVSLGTAVL